MNALVLVFRPLFIFLCSCLPVVVVAQGNPTELVNAIGYSVPTSPAFELLPNKPSEVTNLVTPKDFMGTTPTFINKGKIKTGVAADIRPLTYIRNVSLTDYQKSGFVRALYRTVFAVGTAPDPTNNNDAFLSTGFRMTVVDKGDPRADTAYTNRISRGYSAALLAMGPPMLRPTAEQRKARHKAAVAAVDSLRKQLSKESWNKFRLDIGYAFMARAQNSSYRSDSLKGDRFGFWLAFGGGVGKQESWLRKNMQLNATLKATNIIRTPTDQSETSRYVVGGRARFFLSEKVALSVEVAKLWSNYSKATSLNENWTHFATIAEVNVPQLGGWLTFGYGGDTAHRTAADSKFSFSYAVATNRILK